jgi:hypothetical protein
MKIRYVALAAAICCAAALLLLLSTHRRSGLGKYGLGEFKDFSPMEVYDMVLPVLTKYYLLRQDTGGLCWKRRSTMSTFMQRLEILRGFPDWEAEENLFLTMSV